MKRWILASLAASSATISVAHADSIWDRRDPRYAHLFQDVRARQVGDLLTVVITDSTVANMQDQRAMTKTTSGSGSATLLGPASTNGAAPSGVILPLPSQSSSRQFTGSANQTTNRAFHDRIAVTVVDMMPNGNLVVEGYRSQVVAGEERVLRITGIVRQADIGSANSVFSQQIGNFRISYLGRGPSTKFTTQGPVGRVGNLLWPF